MNATSFWLGDRVEIEIVIDVIRICDEGEDFRGGTRGFVRVENVNFFFFTRKKAGLIKGRKKSNI